MNLLIQKDFTPEKYVKLCKALKYSKKITYTMSNFLKNDKLSNNIIIIRHDVDIFPIRALKMAIIESKFDIQSTYYFRMREKVYDEKIIIAIKNLGHEVGYHYETLADSKGNLDHALKLFSENINRFNKLTKVETISMHGSSLSNHNNLDLWSNNNFKDFDLVGEAYLSIDWNNFDYYTDAGGSWHSEANFRDRPVTDKKKVLAKNTDDIIKIIFKNNNICINIHPDRWNQGIFWQIERVTQQIRNYAKLILRMVKSSD